MTRAKLSQLSLNRQSTTGSLPLLKPDTPPPPFSPNFSFPALSAKQNDDPGGFDRYCEEHIYPRVSIGQSLSR